MQPARRVHNLRHLALAQRKRRVLELFLHIPTPKEPQVPFLACAAAVRLGQRQLPKRGLAAFDAGLVRLDDLVRLVLGPGDGVFTPAGRAPAVTVLHEQVGGTDLARLTLLACPGGETLVAVVFCHVDLELVRVGFGRGFPARDSFDRVEVVR